MPSNKRHECTQIQLRNDPRYNPAELTLGLRIQAHKPQYVLEMVKRLANTPNSARDHDKECFIFIYKTYQNWTLDDFHQALYPDYVQRTMDLLDSYFFARSLTDKPLTRGWAALTGLYVEANVFAEGGRGHQERLELPRELNVAGLASGRGGRTTIFIDALDNGVPRTFKSIVEILVHEMAHAIYMSFACNCVDCNTGGPEVLGYSHMRGHGLLWVEMMEHMMFEIQSWHEDLSDFLSIEEIMRHHRLQL